MQRGPWSIHRCGRLIPRRVGGDRDSGQEDPGHAGAAERLVRSSLDGCSPASASRNPGRGGAGEQALACGAQMIGGSRALGLQCVDAPGVLSAGLLGGELVKDRACQRGRPRPRRHRAGTLAQVVGEFR